MPPLKGVLHSFMGTSTVASSQELAKSEFQRDSFSPSFARSIQSDHLLDKDFELDDLLPGLAFGRGEGKGKGKGKHPKNPPFATISVFSGGFQTLTDPFGPFPTTALTSQTSSPGSDAAPTGTPISNTSTSFQAPPPIPTTQTPPSSPAAVAAAVPPPGTSSGALQGAGSDNGDGDGILGLPSSTGPSLASQTSPQETGSSANEAANETVPPDQTATITSTPVVAMTSAVVFTSDGQTLTSFSTFTTDQDFSTAASLPSAPASLSSSSTVHIRLVMGSVIASVLFCLIAAILAFFVFRRRKRGPVTFVVVNPTTPGKYEELQENAAPTMTHPVQSLIRSSTARRKPVPASITEIPTRHVKDHPPESESDLAEADPFEDQNPFDGRSKPPVRNRLSIMSFIPLDGPVVGRSIDGYAV